jgi:hypothetical protein
MINCTNPGREPKPLRRMQRDCRIEHDRARHDARGWRSSSLTFARSSVTPAKALKSPADRVVGTLICRTVDRFIGGAPTIPSAPFTGRASAYAAGRRNRGNGGACRSRRVSGYRWQGTSERPCRRR